MLLTAWSWTPPGSLTARCANSNCRSVSPAAPIRRGLPAHSCGAGTPPNQRLAPSGCEPHAPVTRHHRDGYEQKSALDNALAHTVGVDRPHPLRTALVELRRDSAVLP